MKIEKLNDFQIRCTLTAEDLRRNQVGITDIAFCSDKAKSLFKDMMQHASEDYGFDLRNASSLMVEMRAVSPDNLVLTITRITGAEDVSRFMAGLSSGFPGAVNGFSDAAGQEGKRSHMEKYKSLLEKAFRYPNPQETETAEGVRSFRFDSLDDVIAASKAAGARFSCINSLYRFGSGNNYQLIIHCEKDNQAEFNNVCESISEYGLSLTCTPATENYLKEHGGLIIENNALQQLACL